MNFRLADFVSLSERTNPSFLVEKRRSRGEERLLEGVDGDQSQYDLGQLQVIRAGTVG